MRFLRSGWFIAAAFVLLTLGWYTWGLDWLAERKWEAYVAEARARGVKLTLAELRPARVPESNDVLQTPVFRGAANAAPYAKVLRQSPAVWRQDVAADGRPTLPDWAATRSAVLQISIDPEEKDHVRALQGALAEFQPLLEGLARIRAQSGNWDDLWTVYGPGTETSFHRVVGAMRLLAFKAELDLAVGDEASARTHLDANMRLAKCVETAPGIGAEAIRQWVDAEFRRVLCSGLEMGIWRDEDFHAFLDFCTRQDVLERYRGAIETSRAQWAEICEKRLGFLQSTKVRWNDLKSWQLLVRSAQKRWWRINGEWMQRFFDEELAGFDAARGMWTVPQPRKFDIAKVDPHDADFALVNMSRGFIGEALPQAVFSHASYKMAGIACALELYRRKHGVYPEQLEQLAPEFLATLPVDPCGGKPFRYRRDESEGYRLYSIAANERDDGGTVGGEWNHPDWRWWAPRIK